MSRRGGVGFLGNTLANLVVGASALGYAALVPAVVVRRFGADQYGTWYLAFQVAAYVVLLDLGSQYVVTNEAAVLAPGPQAGRLTTAAMVVQSGLAVAVVALATGWAFLAGEASLARLVLVLGLAATASLLAATVRSWFVGLRRAHVPAAWLVGARVAAVAGLLAGVVAHLGLVALTLAIAGPQLIVHTGLLLWARRPPSPWVRPDRAAFVRLVRSTRPLAVWTVCGILIGGVDIFIVRAVDPSELGRYAIALPLLALPTGVVTAAITAWMPLVARSESTALRGGRQPTLNGTTVIAAALAVGAIAFIGLADWIVRIWAGPGRWGPAAGYLRLLYLASCLRFVFLPWALLVLTRGEQSAITPVPVTEAVVNVATSVVLGLWLGAIGVALGTLIGALAAVPLYLGWAIPRTSQSGVTARSLVSATGDAWLPLASALGLVLLAAVGASLTARMLAALLALGIDAWWLMGRRQQLLRPLADPTPS